MNLHVGANKVFTLYAYLYSPQRLLNIFYDNPSIHCIKFRICVSKQTVVNN